MSALALLIPLSILIVTVATGVLLWAIRNGQYQDLSNRMPDEAGNDKAAPSSRNKDRAQP